MGGGFRLPHKFVEPRLIENPYFKEKSMSVIAQTVRLESEYAIGVLIVKARKKTKLTEAAEADAAFKLNLFPPREGEPRKIQSCTITFNEEKKTGAVMGCSVIMSVGEMSSILGKEALLFLHPKPQGQFDVEYEMELADVFKEVIVTFPEEDR